MDDFIFHSSDTIYLVKTDISLLVEHKGIIHCTLRLFFLQFFLFFVFGGKQTVKVYWSV